MVPGGEESTEMREELPTSSAQDTPMSTISGPQTFKDEAYSSDSNMALDTQEPSTALKRRRYSRVTSIVQLVIT